MNLYIIPLSIFFSIFLSVSSYALSSVRITEIMYDPSGDGSGEFIEFYNGSDQTVQMGGWSMYGVDFVFPSVSALSPGAYTTIARNMPVLQANHPSTRISGQYGGKIKGSGELIRIQDSGGNVVSQVSYSFGGAWPSAPRNGGPSLSLIWPNANETIPGCWGSSITNGGSPGFPNSASGGGNCATVGYPVTPPPPTAPSSTTSQPSQSLAATPGAGSSATNKNSSNGSSSNNSSVDGKETKAAQQTQAEALQKQHAKQEQQKKLSEQSKDTATRNNWIIASAILIGLAFIIAALFAIRRYKLSQDVKIILRKGESRA